MTTGRRRHRREHGREDEIHHEQHPRVALAPLYPLLGPVRVARRPLRLAAHRRQSPGFALAGRGHLHDNPEWYRQLRLCPWFEIAMRRDFE